MRLQKMSVLVGIVILAIVALGVIWLLLLSKSVVWSFKDKGEASIEPTFVVFNPFRDKDSESEAEKFLLLLKNGECEKVILILERKEKYADMCERESLNKLEDWMLSNRKDNGESVKLYYRLKRSPATNYSGEMWFDLEKEVGKWKVKNIEAVY